jgi:hypothetical protein
MSRRCSCTVVGLVMGLIAGCGDGPIDAVGLVPGSLSTDLVAHWTFDDGTGALVRDSSGKGHDGTINGSTSSWLEQGRFAGALHLEQGDYVAVDNFPNATAGWTVATWVRLASEDVGIGEVTVISTEDVFKGGWEVNLTALDADLHYHFGFWSGPGSYDYTSFDCKRCLVPDRWQHLTAVVDGDALTLAFYLDGVLKTRRSIPQAISPGVSTLYMGRWATTDPARLLAGSLDDTAIWSRPLVSAEIALLVRAPVP